MEKTKLNEIDFEDEIEATVTEQDENPNDGQKGSGVVGFILKFILVLIGIAAVYLFFGQ